MAAKGKYGKLINNTAIIAAGQFGSKVLVYLLVRFYTTVLTQTEYSIASNITEMATLLIPLISLGIGEAVFRFAMDKDYLKKDVFTNGFIAFFGGSLLFLIIIPILSAIPYFDGLVWLIVVYVMASILHSLCSQFIRARGQFKLFAVQGFVNTALTIFFNIIFLIPLKMSYVGYVLSVACADTLTTLFIVVVAKLWEEIDFSAASGKTLRKMMIYSIPMIPTTIFWWVTTVSDRYMVTFFKGDAVNGLYTAAYKIPTLLMVLSGIFVNAWRNSAVDERESSDYKYFFGKVFDVFINIIFIIAAAIIAFTPIITRMMFAESYYDAWIYIPILTFAMVFYNFVSFTGSVYVVEKKTKWSFYTSLSGAVTNIILNFILIPTFSAYGAAIATAASFVVSFIFRLITTRKMVDYPVNFTRFCTCTALIILQTVFMTLKNQIGLWVYLIQAILLILVIVITAPVLIDALLKIVKGRSNARNEQQTE